LIRAITKRDELGLKADDFVIISVGELNSNKNHEIIIKAISKLKNTHIKYVICGQGNLEKYLIQKIKQYRLENQVMLLGYRTDVKELLSMSDLFAFPSKREGLGMAALEAMAVGLPLLTSNVHGINDYSIQGVTGYKENVGDYSGYANDIEKCKVDQSTLYVFSKYNQKKVCQFDSTRIDQMMQCIYNH